MVVDCAASARAKAVRPTAKMAAARDPQRYFLCAAFGLSLADVARQLSAMADGFPLVHALARRRHLRAPEPRAGTGGPGPGRAGTVSVSRRYRQPERQDNRGGRPLRL